MFPIGDDDSSRRTVPLVTYALLALNVLFFFVELSLFSAPFQSNREQSLPI